MAKRWRDEETKALLDYYLKVKSDTYQLSELEKLVDKGRTPRAIIDKYAELTKIAKMMPQPEVQDASKIEAQVRAELNANLSKEVVASVPTQVRQVLGVTEDGVTKYIDELPFNLYTINLTQGSRQLEYQAINVKTVEQFRDLRTTAIFFESLIKRRDFTEQTVKVKNILPIYDMPVGYTLKLDSLLGAWKLRKLLPWIVFDLTKRELNSAYFEFVKEETKA